MQKETRKSSSFDCTDAKRKEYDLHQVNPKFINCVRNYLIQNMNCEEDSANILNSIVKSDSFNAAEFKSLMSKKKNLRQVDISNMKRHFLRTLSQKLKKDDIKFWNSGNR